jgi:hypothetical protein
MAAKTLGPQRAAQNWAAQEGPKVSKPVTTPRCHKAVLLSVLSALFLLTGGAMTKAQDFLTPILSRQPQGAMCAGERAIEELSQRPASQSLDDPANLLPIGSINSRSDIRPFLLAGVPADLRRAALRRAWSVDPKIRDFIGLSENSWDFNAAGSMPGFGSLTAEDSCRLLARSMEQKESFHAASSSSAAPDGIDSDECTRRRDATQLTSRNFMPL